MVPAWVVVVVPVVTYIIGAFTTPIVDLIKTRMTTRQAGLAAAATDATTQRGQDLSKSQSDRTLILQVAELLRSEDKRPRDQGFAMLSGLVSMNGLSEDDAVLAAALARSVSEPRYSDARRALAEGETVQFSLEVGTSTQPEGGDDDDDQGH